VSAYAYIEVAARAQKWVDMGISRNMYLDIRDIDEIMNIYTTAWDKGLKTTYYLHMKPRHSAEQSTTTVNKAQALGRRGFGVLKDKIATPMTEEQNAVIIENNTFNINPTTVNITSNPVAALSSNKPEIILPEDPNDAMLCESCQ
ncbi:MAG: ribonucleoside-diphosphate reductase subunit alpha, partial [Patescibacteria group bacterium]